MTKERKRELTQRLTLGFVRVSLQYLSFFAFSIAIVSLADYLGRDVTDVILVLGVTTVGARTIHQLRRSTAESSIYRAPGQHLARITSFLYSAKTVERVFDEILGDLTEEYCEALVDDEAQDRRYIRKATWVRIRGYWSFWSAALLQTWVSLAKRIFDIWKMIG